MIRLSSIFILIIAGMVAFQSCSKKKSDCAFLGPSIVYTGFTEAETDTLIVRRYEKNGLFTNLIDTALISKADITRTIVGTDSVTLTSPKYTLLQDAMYANDFEIYLPGSNRTFKITGVDATFNQEKEPSTICQSFANTVYLDGVKYTFTTFFDTPYRIYATK